MRICHGLLLIWLALLSRVSGERPQAVVATIPNEGFLQNVADNESSPIEEGFGGGPMTDLEVTGFITKSGDIFELPAGRSMGSIEAREAPDLKPEMTMCRYGNIVVYSNSDCNSFFSPPKYQNRPPNELEGDAAAAKPAKKRNKVKRNKLKPNRRRNQNKKRNNKNRQQQQRRKALKKKQNQKRRRRNNLKNGGKRGNNFQKRNKKRINNKNFINKRRRINDEEERSNIPKAPLLYTILLSRH